MKPYLLVLYNKIMIFFLKLTHKNFSARGIQMISRDNRLIIGKNAKVTFGDRLITDGRTVIIADEDSDLFIGDNVYFNENAMISCKNRIYIGSGCKFGPNVCIFDNSHRFNSMSGVSNDHTSGVIEIGCGCWIGSNVVILKETKIGKNSVIGAGCVISGEIPEGSIVTQGRDLLIREMEC